MMKQGVRGTGFMPCAKLMTLFNWNFNVNNVRHIKSNNLLDDKWLRVWHQRQGDLRAQVKKKVGFWVFSPDKPDSLKRSLQQNLLINFLKCFIKLRLAPHRANIKCLVYQIDKQDILWQKFISRSPYLAFIYY